MNILNLPGWEVTGHTPEGVTALRLGVDIDRLLETLEAEERGRTTSNLPAGKGRPKK